MTPTRVGLAGLLIALALFLALPQRPRPRRYVLHVTPAVAVQEWRDARRLERAMPPPKNDTNHQKEN